MEVLLTIPQTAATLNISISTVRRMISDGRLSPVLRVGLRGVRIPMSTIHAYLTAAIIDPDAYLAEQQDQQKSAAS